MGLLRLAAIGAVDDGKSTLIGRLLHDSAQLPEDQLEAIRRMAEARGQRGLDLSLATDGLREERERGITIDVAYRYARSGPRKVVIADCPGHFEYTKNMATGASTADAALVLVDATRGLRQQTRRHLAIAALFGIEHFVLAVNKMDLLDWDGEAFSRLSDEVSALLQRLAARQMAVVPVSALHGDNVVSRGGAAWYSGPTVADALARVPVGTWAASPGGRARLPVQLVLEGEDGPAYGGMLAGGSLRRGDRVVVLPRGVTSLIAHLETLDGARDEAHPAQSVTVRLAQAMDLARGDVIAHASHPPQVLAEAQVTICWFAPQALRAGARLLMKQATSRTAVLVSGVDSCLDLNRVELVAADQIAANGIGIAQLQLDRPAVADPYRHNRMTGAFVLVQPDSQRTVAAGMFGLPAIADRAGVNPFQS
ncbi:MAG: sulfate adenylyltransferase subunit 1 [Candidatus Dormibacteria bacterium]